MGMWSSNMGMVKKEKGRGNGGEVKCGGWIGCFENKVWTSIQIYN